jgi:glucose/arabinose dehydrogenase
MALVLGLFVWQAALALQSPAPDGSQEPPAPFRTDARVPLESSTVQGSPDPPLPYRGRKAFPNLKFRNSLYAAVEPGTGRIVVVEQHGRILAFENDPGVAKAQTILKLKDAWTYSLHFHPKYLENHWVYIFSNGPPDTEPHKKNRILRYEVRNGVCDPATERLIIEWVSNGHDGGEMGFGPDEMLYITAGDGTTDSDRNLTGQDLSDLNSGMIRIDVEHPDPGRAYSIPPDNPFLKIPGARGELWAYGFRNPWRMCFDRKTGDLWVGDIGQDLWEMIEVVHRGDNYGWSVFEGTHPFYPQRKLGPTPVTPPVLEHPHSEARSITGGFVYHGERYPELQGAYLYGDYSVGRVWAARYAQGKITYQRELAKTPFQILGLCEGPRGEIYMADYGGQICELESSPPVLPRRPFPRRLSDSGLFASVREHRPRAALIPYDVNSPLWSDGAFKERFIALPGLSQIDYVPGEAWRFPEGTVLVKTFSIEREKGNPSSRERIETRFLTFQEGEWAGYSYRWNDDQTDATLVEAAGLHRELAIRDASAPGGVRTQRWYYPSRADCMVCHSRAAGFVLGLNTLQMNKLHDYGGERQNQLRVLERLGALRVNLQDCVRAAEAPWVERPRASGKTSRPPRSYPKEVTELLDPALFGPGGLDPAMNALEMGYLALRRGIHRKLEREPRFTGRLPRPPEETRRLADPGDPEAPLDSRVRSYLHANCAQCHVEAGGGNSAIDLHRDTPAERMRLIGVKPLHDAFGIGDPLLVAPGNPDRSVLLYRLTRRGPGQMPPLASSQVDPRAAELLREWILKLK